MELLYFYRNIFPLRFTTLVPCIILFYLLSLFFYTNSVSCHFVSRLSNIYWWDVKERNYDRLCRNKEKYVWWQLEMIKTKYVFRLETFTKKECKFRVEWILQKDNSFLFKNLKPKKITFYYVSRIDIWYLYCWYPAEFTYTQRLMIEPVHSRPSSHGQRPRPH